MNLRFFGFEVSLRETSGLVIRLFSLEFYLR